MTKSTNEAKITKQIRLCLGILNFKNFILWSYVPLLADCLGKLGEKMSIFETVDNWSLHQSYQNKPKIKNQLEKNYQIISQKADFIFTVSQDLLKLYPGRKNVFWIPNGVDLDHFHSQPKISKLFSSFQKSIIGYVGVIQNRIDIDILTAVAKKFNQCSIILIGPTWPKYFKSFRPKSPEVKRLEQYPNVHFLGQVPYWNIPNYLAAFDVAIIPHKKNKFTASMDPLKLYEYLAAGKPIVSTPVSGVEQFGNLVKVAQTKDDFCQKIEESFSLNTTELIQKRRIMVIPHSWKNKVDQMLSYLNL